MESSPGQRSELWRFIAENASFGYFLNQRVEIIDELPHLHAEVKQDRVQSVLHVIMKNGSHQEQEALIERLIQEIETLFAQQPPKKPIKWLQKGKRTGLPPFQPVTPEPGSPSASDIIIAQRDRLSRWQI